MGQVVHAAWNGRILRATRLDRGIEAAATCVELLWGERTKEGFGETRICHTEIRRKVSGHVQASPSRSSARNGTHIHTTRRADPPVSAGFATVHGNNSLTINAVEAYPLDKFSAEVGDDTEGGV